MSSHIEHLDASASLVKVLTSGDTTLDGETVERELAIEVRQGVDGVAFHGTASELSSVIERMALLLAPHLSVAPDDGRDLEEFIRTEPGVALGLRRKLLRNLDDGSPSAFHKELDDGLARGAVTARAHARIVHLERLY